MQKELMMLKPRRLFVVKDFTSVLCKFGIGFVVNLLAILSTILNLWEFVKNFAVNLVNKFPVFFLAVLSATGICCSVFFIASPEFPSIWLKLLGLLFVWGFIAVLFRFSKVITNFICTILEGFLSLLSVSNGIVFMRDAIQGLVDRYLNFSTDMRAIDRWYVFGVCFVINLFNKAFQIVRRVLVVAFYPALAIAGGWLGYWFTFVYLAPSELWSPGWWLSILMIALSGAIGIVVAYALNETVEDAMELADFDLFYVFEIYATTFRHFSHNDSSSAPVEQPTTSNEYYILLSACTNLEDLKRNYKRMARDVHPDVSELPAQIACERMKELNEAYEYLRGKFA